MRCSDVQRLTFGWRFLALLTCRVVPGGLDQLNAVILKRRYCMCPMSDGAHAGKKGSTRSKTSTGPMRRTR
ncbi:hypothetical protein [Xylella taiwanensis]|uniref:Uncharacterized protein n=1 Tax=Xylella taiwanensis TaxID=1444770 RepID=Z9JHA5_9GAMM|nr:hypothetical protein [Xylella taiwanensis]AXI83638.1 hypothetical protein AB672_06685 [Xylella taiwanensis]EWS77795.1 hypothetical protein AF72_08935 [Xylella taiwanensis]MCD8465780.1 hypothetical protein [Xylella taiwanensis]